LIPGYLFYRMGEYSVGNLPPKMPTTTLHPDIQEVLFDADVLRARIKELAASLSQDYQGKDPVLVGVLKGSALFLADLVREMTIPCTIDFVSMASYEGESSTGEVRLLLDLRSNPHGKHVVIVEDIVDTGLSLSSLMENIKAKRPASVEICVLLDKKETRKIPVSTKYVGFEIPNKFVIGYGLDYNEKYRQLPYVGILKDSAI